MQDEAVGESLVDHHRIGSVPEAGLGERSCARGADRTASYVARKASALRADEDHLEVRAFAIRWTGPHENERAHVLRSRWSWRDLPADPVQRIEVVRPVIEAAAAERRAAFVACRFCQRLTPRSGDTAPTPARRAPRSTLGVMH
ncbi:hypothetical protein [Nannocystis pusilla]|uniref:hypothetical protein n=1 Tax=Nannocystis pusilla TaxID=889268 RepID=UPI003B7CC1E3